MTLKLEVPYYVQNRDYTCGPACVRMVMAYFDVQQDEVSLTMLCRTTLVGTGLSEIVEAGRHFGFQGEWKIMAKFSDLTASLKRGIPIMAMVDARVLHGIEMPIPVGHMIVLLAINDDIIYHDPEIGPAQKISRSIFSAAWENVRKRMVIIWPEKETQKRLTKR